MVAPLIAALPLIGASVAGAGAAYGLSKLSKSSSDTPAAPVPPPLPAPATQPTSKPAKKGMQQSFLSGVAGANLAGASQSGGQGGKTLLGA